MVSTGIAVVPIERLHHSVTHAETEITVVQSHPSAQRLGGLEAWRLGGLEAWRLGSVFYRAPRDALSRPQVYSDPAHTPTTIRFCRRKVLMPSPRSSALKGS